MAEGNYVGNPRHRITKDAIEEELANLEKQVVTVALHPSLDTVPIIVLLCYGLHMSVLYVIICETNCDDQVNYLSESHTIVLWHVGRDTCPL